MAAGAARGAGMALMVLAGLVLLVAVASVLLPGTVGRLVADLWIGVMSAIGQLLGG